MNVSRLCVKELKTSLEGHSIKRYTGIQFAIGFRRFADRKSGKMMKLFEISQNPHLDEPHRATYVGVQWIVD